MIYVFQLTYTVASTIPLQSHCHHTHTYALSLFSTTNLSLFLLEHSVHQHEKHNKNSSPHPVQYKLLLHLPPPHALHDPPRSIRHPRNLPHPTVRARYRLPVTSQLLRDFKCDALGFGHDGSGVGEGVALGSEGFRVAEEAFLAAAVVVISIAVGVRRVVQSEAVSFDESFGGFVIVS